MNNKKVTATNSDSYKNLNFADSKNKSSISANYRRGGNLRQCVRCDSDYMKFASKDGYCQDCQQRAEFIIREHPHVLNRARTQNHGRLS